MRKKLLKDGTMVVETEEQPKADRTINDEFNAGIRAIIEICKDKDVMERIKTGKKVRVRY